MIVDNALLEHISNYQLSREQETLRFEEAERHRASTRLISVIKWLSSGGSSPAVTYEHILQNHDSNDPQSGKWILEKEEMKAWLGDRVPKSSILWVQGRPGFGGLLPIFVWIRDGSNFRLDSIGKSVLSSVIIEHLKGLKDKAVSFFFCKHQDPTRSRFVNVQKGLLTETLKQRRHLVPHFYEMQQESGEPVLESPKLCQTLMKVIIQDISRGFIVLDGVDECPRDQIGNILMFLKELVDESDKDNPGKLRLLVMSRHEPEIERVLRGSETLRLGEADIASDIESYVRKQCQSLQEMEAFRRYLNQDDIDYVIKNVTDSSDGMFSFFYPLPWILAANLE